MEMDTKPILELIEAARRGADDLTGHQSTELWNLATAASRALAEWDTALRLADELCKGIKEADCNQRPGESGLPFLEDWEWIMEKARAYLKARGLEEKRRKYYAEKEGVGGTVKCIASGKQRHMCKGGAEAQLRSLKLRFVDYEGTVFHCGYCYGWHVGRLKKGAHRNRQKE